MIKIILCTSQVVIKMACSLLDIYHNTITHKDRVITPVSYDDVQLRKYILPRHNKYEESEQ